MTNNTLIPAADPNNILFETEMIEDARGEARRDGLRTGSRLSFGEPAVYDLVDLLKAAGGEPDFEIRSQLDRYDFRLVRLVATLHVERHSAVSWFEVRVKLNPVDDEASADAAERPIAHDLYPLNVTDKVEIERTAKISPAFKFMDVSVSVGESSLVTKYVRLEPKITAYGKRESSPYWRYTPGSGSEVVGGVREMDVIVRRPRGVPVKAAIVAQGNGRQWGIFADPVGVRRQGFEI